MQQALGSTFLEAASGGVQAEAQGCRGLCVGSGPSSQAFLPEQLHVCGLGFLICQTPLWRIMGTESCPWASWGGLWVTALWPHCAWCLRDSPSPRACLGQIWNSACVCVHVGEGDTDKAGLTSPFSTGRQSHWLPEIVRRGCEGRGASMGGGSRQALSGWLCPHLTWPRNSSFPPPGTWPCF